MTHKEAKTYFKISQVFTWITIFVFVLNNMIFGWDKTAQSKLEAFADGILSITISISVIALAVPIIVVIKELTLKYLKNKHKF